jgi:Alpha/beta hydrolase domain containing 18
VCLHLGIDLTYATLLQVCIAGWSMGGIHACMAASLSRHPVACAAVMPPRSAAVAFCDGTLSEFVDVRRLTSGVDDHGTPILSLLAREYERHPVFPNTATVFATHPTAQSSLARKQPVSAADIWQNVERVSFANKAASTAATIVPAIGSLEWLPTGAEVSKSALPSQGVRTVSPQLTCLSVSA